MPNIWAKCHFARTLYVHTHARTHTHTHRVTGSTEITELDIELVRVDDEGWHLI